MQSEIHFINIASAKKFCQVQVDLFQSKDLMSSYYLYSTEICKQGTIQKSDLAGEFHSTPIEFKMEI
jgi:hypothetical protein